MLLLYFGHLDGEVRQGFLGLLLASSIPAGSLQNEMGGWGGAGIRLSQAPDVQEDEA